MIRAAAALLAAALLAPAAARATPGETWEQTTEMQIQGVPFAMPAQRWTFCKPLGSGWEDPPEQQQDSDCETTVLKRTATSLEWKMVCKGKERMEGEGDMTWTPTTYAGTMKMRSSDGDMSMKLSGKRVGKPCDAEEQQREAKARVKEIEAQQASAGAMICESGVEQMAPGYFTGNPPMCADRTKRDELCARARTREGFAMLRSRGEADVGVAVKLCKLDVAKLEAGFCDSALRDEDLEFLGDRCPAQVKALAKRECAGRTYTDVRSSYRDFCVRFAADEMAKPEVVPARRSSDAAKESGKKVLKGLFGR